MNVDDLAIEGVHHEKVNKHAPFPSTISFNGYDYIAKAHHPRDSPTSCYYNCSHDRATKSRPGCTAKLTLSCAVEEGTFVYKESGSHICCFKANVGDIIDCSEEAKTLALSQSRIKGVNAQQAATNAILSIKEKYAGQFLDIPSHGSLVNSIHAERSSKSWSDSIHEPPLLLCAESKLFFLQFDKYYNSGEKMERMIGWAHPRLIDLLSIKTTHFWDGTFHVSSNILFLLSSYILATLGGTKRIFSSYNIDGI
jgi:hypothetical protein